MASIFVLALASVRISLLELHEPLSRLLLPITANDLSRKGHIFAESPDLANLIQILPDIGCIRKESWPIGLGMRTSKLVIGTDAPRRLLLLLLLPEILLTFSANP